MRKVVISGASGQDGTYLSQLLLQKQYEVHGLVRSLGRKLDSRIIQHKVDVTDQEQIRTVIEKVKPDEVYHLATGHEVGFKTDDHALTKATDFESTDFFLKAIFDFNPQTRFFYASSSRVFGAVKSSPQNEDYPLSPISEYAKAKIASMQLVREYRDHKNIFACTGILFNHESPLRNPFFLTRKISQTAAQIKLGLAHEIELGDLTARRDWGYAGDFVQAMWLMLQAETAKDYVIGTGQTHSVQDILEVVFSYLKLDWRKFVRVKDEFKRAPEPYEVVADISRIQKDLGWKPVKKFDQMMIEMLEEDLKLFSKN